MKKIIILMPSMFIGGAERSLLGLLETIDYSQYDVSLFLYRHEGEFLNFCLKCRSIEPLTRRSVVCYVIEKYGLG